APQNEFVVGCEFVGFQPGQGGRGGAEDGGDISAVCPLTDGGGIAPAAQCQGQGVDENGFTGAGFTREHGEPRLETELGVVDDDEIADVQGEQHGGQGLFDVVGGLWHAVPAELAPQRGKEAETGGVNETHGVLCPADIDA